MKITHTNNRRLGAILWLLSIQYYVMQLVVATFWAKDSGYSWTKNTISDLANTHCGRYGGRLVCSPQHTIMNFSFIILGITMVGGSYFLRKELAASQAYRLGLAFTAIAGVGTILVGLFPENTISTLHIIGAALPFTVGNLGMVVLGTCLRQQPILLRGYSILSGIVGLTALVLFITNTYLGIGIGGMERFVGYPLTIWMIVFGSYLLLIDRFVTTQV